MDIMKTLSDFLKDRFNLSNFKAHEEDTIESVKRNVDFKGTNLWILIFAIMLASVGLNVNSTAVIIGAMLISPLMGPIMGLGLGAAINDFTLVKRAGKNLLIATVISILTSAFYFYISPLNEAQSELLARTSPSIWDVLIAFFGGMAGIIASSSKEKGNVIPGVAIATALMPPLCTAGYGIATGQILYFLGAFYLYFINSTFIFISTFIVIRFLKYHKVEFVNPQRESQVKRYIMILVLITVIPSSVMAYFIVEKAIFNNNANQFISREFNIPNSQIISKEIEYERNHRVIRVLVLGDPISEESQVMIRSKMNQYNLANTELIIKQGAAGMGRFDIATIKSDLVEDLYQKNTELLANKDREILELKEQLMSVNRNREMSVSLFEEIKALHPGIIEFGFISDGLFVENTPQDSTCFAYAKFSSKPSSKNWNQLKNWLQVRTGCVELKLIGN